MSDLDIAIDFLNAEADVIEQVLTQAVAGNVESKAMLAGLVSEARQYQKMYADQGVSVPAPNLDRAIRAAENYLATKAVTLPAGSPGRSIFSAQGVRLGALVVPWIGVGAAVLFIGTAIYLSRPKRAQRARGRS